MKLRRMCSMLQLFDKYQCERLLPTFNARHGCMFRMPTKAFRQAAIVLSAWVLVKELDANAKQPDTSREKWTRIVSLPRLRL